MLQFPVNDVKDVKDDKNGHLIYASGDIIDGKCILKIYISCKKESEKFFSDEIVETLGEGTFGKVVEAKNVTNPTRPHLALKIIKNVERYRLAARLEIDVLNKLKQKDPQKKHLVIQVRKSNHHAI